MTGREIAYLGCRLIAIYWALNVIYSAAGLVESLLLLSSGALGKDATQSGAFLLHNGVLIALYLFLAVGLWIGAKPLAQRIAPGSTSLPENRNITLREVQAIAFSAVGLFILIGALPKLGAEIYKTYLLGKTFDVPPVASLREKTYPFQLALELFFGLALFLGGRGFGGWLFWFRELGMKSKTSNNGLKSDAQKRRAP